MTTTIPPGSISIFWENISQDSLDSLDFATILEDHRPPNTSSRTTPPSHIALPPVRRMSITPEKRATSPTASSSPKLSGWHFLKRHAGPSSLQVAIPSTLPQPQPTQATIPFSSASPTSATRRPGNSRSTTWTDNLPTTRALTHEQPNPLSTASPRAQAGTVLPPAHKHIPVRNQEPYYPPSPHTAPPQPTHSTPPIVVVPMNLNQPRGRFGLFRRGSLSPKIEKGAGGFFGGLVSPADLSGKEEKKRLKGLGKQKRGSLSGSSTTAGPSSDQGWLSPPQPLFSPSSHQQRFPSSSSNAPSFRRPASPLSPFYAPNPSNRHTTYLAPSSPVHSPSPTLFNSPCSPSGGPSILPPSPHQSSRLAGRGTGRPSLDFHPGRPHVVFPHHNPASSSSLCSVSADDEDDGEDFPFREARPAKASKRKIRPSSQRGRSCSPSRAGEADKGTRAWWKGATSGGGLGDANRASVVLGSSAPSSRGSMDFAWGGRRGSVSQNVVVAEPQVMERGFKVTSRPASPASLQKRGPIGTGRSGLRPEGQRNGVVTSEATPSPPRTPRMIYNDSPNQTYTRISASSTPRLLGSDPVSRSNSVRPGIPSRNNSIHSSWTPPPKPAPQPPSSSTPSTPHINSFPGHPSQPTPLLLPLGPVLPPAPPLSTSNSSSEDSPCRISPTLSDSTHQHGTEETGPTTDEEELDTSCEGGRHGSSEVLDGWEERRWSVSTGQEETGVRC